MAQVSGGPNGRGRDLVPFAAACVVAVTSVAALALAVRYGWLGPDEDRGATFCERSTSILAQPANTLSNAGFVLAGLVIGWQARHRDRLGHTLSHSRALVTVLACVVVLLGPASAAMHATESALGGILDMTSMYLIASFAAAYAWSRVGGWSTGRFVAVFAALVVACELVGLVPWSVPVLLHPGNAAFLTLLLSALAGELRLRSRSPLVTDRGWGYAAVGVLLVAFAIWNAGQHGWCDPGSLWQAHAAWHLLCAVAAYLLFRLYASERVAAESTNQTVSS